mmetsp:Transcript_30054/g.94257  ORF Transcript_30054/g.94257 Transcript_30054/m.94257 type:complete len:205 (-) Transcript_30054:325-939(-)
MLFPARHASAPRRAAASRVRPAPGGTVRGDRVGRRQRRRPRAHTLRRRVWRVEVCAGGAGSRRPRRRLGSDASPRRRLRLCADRRARRQTQAAVGRLHGGGGWGATCAGGPLPRHCPRAAACSPCGRDAARAGWRRGAALLGGRAEPGLWGAAWRAANGSDGSPRPHHRIAAAVTGRRAARLLATHHAGRLACLGAAARGGAVA